MVWHASRPVACSLPQSLTHCGSGETRSTFDGGCGAAGWPPSAPGAPGVGAAGAGAAGFSFAVCASAAPEAKARLVASAAAPKRVIGRLIKDPFKPYAK